VSGLEQVQEIQWTIEYIFIPLSNYFDDIDISVKNIKMKQDSPLKLPPTNLPFE